MERERVKDMQQRAQGWNQTRGRCSEDMLRCLYQLSYQGAPDPNNLGQIKHLVFKTNNKNKQHFDDLCL